MILYRPIDGEVLSSPVKYQPSTCFLMTKLGTPVPKDLQRIRKRIASVLKKEKIKIIDANSVVTGRDFLLNIWHSIISVPIGIALLHDEMTNETMSNIFYEVGMMQAYGKEVLIVKTSNVQVPSDFVRTQYIEVNDQLESNIEKYLDGVIKIAEHYTIMADQFENDPLLAIDYLRRSFLISNDKSLREKAKQIFDEAGLEGRAKNSVERYLVNF